MKWLDTEWNEAERANETPKYYKCSYETFGGTHVFIKLYKPSLAKLMEKRTGWKIEEI